MKTRLHSFFLVGGYSSFWSEFVGKFLASTPPPAEAEIEKIPHKILLFAKQIQIGIKAKKLVSLLLGFEF